MSSANNGEEDEGSLCPYPPWNYSWIVDNKLAGMAWPQTVENLEFLIEDGIKHLVTLSKEKLPPIEKVGDRLRWTLIDVEEFEAPSLDNIKEFIEICERCAEKNEPVGIHCRMGRGRTGVMAACYLVRFQDLAPETAVATVRLQRHGSVETPEQERAVKMYHDYLRSSA